MRCTNCQISAQQQRILSISEESKKMSENWKNITKHLTHEQLDETEAAYIDEMKANAEFKSVLDEADDTLKKIDYFFDLKKIDTNIAWEKVNRQLEQPKKVISLPLRLTQIAAIALLVLSTSFITWKLIEISGHVTFKTAQTEDSHPEVVLPDGSKVALNHGSKLTYPKQFKGNTRVVRLSGEAFFEVTHNAEKPFIIQTKNAAVKVLGTSFNVQAYDSDETVEVFVKTGKVELMQTGSELAMNNKVLLLPGEKGTFNSITSRLLKEVTEKSNDMAWLTHEIEFDATPLNKVIETIERAYNINIDVDENVDLSLELTSTFNRQDPNYIMEVVAFTHGLHLNKINQNTYVIKK